jgi:hypothetical protein
MANLLIISALRGNVNDMGSDALPGERIIYTVLDGGVGWAEDKSIISHVGSAKRPYKSTQCG